MIKKNQDGGQRYALLAMLVFAPAVLGAKGCDRAVVGNEGNAGTAGMETGGSTTGVGGSTTGVGGGMATGGSPDTGGSSGTGTGGSPDTGGTGTSGGTGGTGGGRACGGLRGDGCEDGEYCDFPPDAICGAADATGICRAIPEACADIYAPVCGCDDQTHSNACYAHMAGVSVASDGECELEGEPCGGFLGDTCAEGEYCEYPPDAMCGRADGSGVCRVMPEACDLNYDPVCGCDGNTYGNECEANMAGISAEFSGECESQGESCGGLTGAMCPDGMFCSYSREAMCGAADQTGTCETIPAACTREYSPVCGCDGETYDNECMANAAGTSAAAAGECGVEPPDFCGGIAGFTCPDGMFCNYPIETMCGQGDMTGTCEVPSEICTDEYDPVCGCDGMTYSNACDAHGNGQSVLSEGECEGG